MADRIFGRWLPWVVLVGGAALAGYAAVIGWWTLVAANTMSAVAMAFVLAAPAPEPGGET